MKTAASTGRCNNGGCTREVYRGKECFICWCGTKWDSMKQRTDHRNGRNLSYSGVPLLISRREFIGWAVKNPPPQDIHHPSIDRIHGESGYVFGNIRWLEFSRNCRRDQRDVPSGFWLCHKCKRVLPLTLNYFHKSVQMKSGFQCYCKSCRSRRSNYENRS